MSYDFFDKLEVSKGRRSPSDMGTIKAILLGCVSVEAASIELDKLGVDYIAILRGGARVLIDVKTRDAGCSKFWKDGPEFAIEMWSVMPGGKFNTPDERKKAGWTLDEAKLTDMILYTWDVTDCAFVYLLSFQTLRMAAQRNIAAWMKTYKTDIQESNRNSVQWQSKAVFVPADVVQDAMREVQRFVLPIDTPSL